MAINQQQTGFTLIELIVTLVISSVLLLGTLSVLTNNFSMSRANDRFSRMNENGLIGMNFIADDLGMVGYTGCGSNIESKVPFVNTGDLFDVVAPSSVNPARLEILFIDGLDDTGGNKVWSRSGEKQLQAEIENGTDAITLRKFRGAGALLTADMENGNSNIAADITFQNPKDGDLAAIYDCIDVDIVQVKKFDAGKIEHGGLSKAYSVVDNEDDLLGEAGRITLFDTVRYYIGKDDNGQPGLWREIPPGNTAASRQELVTGIEDMQILYGVASDSVTIPDQYLRADQIDGEGNKLWRNVVSAKIALLVTSNYVSTGGDDSLLNQEESEDFLKFKQQQVDDGVKHILLDKEVAVQADAVVRRVIVKEFFFRNQQYTLANKYLVH